MYNIIAVTREVSFVVMLLLCYCLQSAMEFNSLKKRHNILKSTLARTRSWCVESSGREGSAFGRKIKRFAIIWHYFFAL